MQIRLHTQFTTAHQAIILKYFRAPNSLSQIEWVTALAAFDALSACEIVTVSGRTLTFAQFYQQVLDRPFASALMAALVQLEDVEKDGNKCAAAYQKQTTAALAASGLAGSLTENQRLLVAYCFYWWNAFVKGYLAELAVFRDLQTSGIVFQPHDLTQPAGRYSLQT